MKKGIRKYHLDGLAALILFGIFAVCVMIVLMTGADAYRRLVRRDEAVHDRRTCVQYITTRVRQAERPNRIWVETFGSGNALALADHAGGITRVYYHDGYIMELYTDADHVLSPEAGERVIEADGLDLLLEDGMLTVTVTDLQGEQSVLKLALYNGGEEKDT